MEFLNTSLPILTSPLESFTVYELLDLDLLGYSFTITNYMLYLTLTFFVIVYSYILSMDRVSLVDTRYSLALDSSISTISTIVKEQIGSSYEYYLPLVYGLFFYILILNLSGNIPYGFTATTSLVLALGLSLTVWLSVTLIGLQNHGIKFFSFFVPTGTPLALVPMLSLIEMISYIARAFSLGVRLFANTTAGHTLLTILSGFLYPLLSLTGFIILIVPGTLFIALVGLEIAVSFIQAFVFNLLLCSYLKDAIYLH
jgi:F-type H+-transporting ATPase subunit a